jgi:hypothetical protein
MSGHWRLAVRGAASMVFLAGPVVVAIFYFYGMAQAGAFVYGVGTGIPAYLGLWPVLPMLVGFAGVYLAENVVLLPGAMKIISNPGAKRAPGDPVGEGEERRVEI